MDDEWYNASLPRYPRVLIQREQGMSSDNPSMSRTYQRSASGSNVIRIRVQGGQQGHTASPHVSIHQYSGSSHLPANQVTAETLHSGVTTSIPVQKFHMTSSPITMSTTGCPEVSIPIAHVKGPMKAIPLSKVVRQDSKSSQINQSSIQYTGRIGQHDRSVSPALSPESPDNGLFNSFTQEFDRLTAELTGQGISRHPQMKVDSNSSMARGDRSYGVRRHASASDAQCVRSQTSPNTPLTRLASHPHHRFSGTTGEVRELSPGVFRSSFYSAGRSSPSDNYESKRGSEKSPNSNATGADNFQWRTNQSEKCDDRGNAKMTSRARAKMVLDKVLRDLVSKDDTDSGYDGSGDTTKAGFTLSSVEIKERIRKYNDSNHNSKITEATENQVDTFRGDIQVCLCLENAVDMLLSTRPTSLLHSYNQTSREEERITASARIPEYTVTKLHIASEDNSDDVIQQLLNKFNITNSLKAFALYEQTLENEREVKLRKLANSESPLLNYLRWKTESQVQKRFVLKESHQAEIMWEAFSLPELNNFLAMLDLEFQNQKEIIQKKYVAYKQNLDERLAELLPNSGLSVEGDVT